MTSQFESFVERPRQPKTLGFIEFQVEHDHRPLWNHTSKRVPGVRRGPSRALLAARMARETGEAMIQGITDVYALSAALAAPAGPEVRVGDCLIPTDSTEQEALDGTTIDLPDDEPAGLEYDHYPELLHDMRDER